MQGQRLVEDKLIFQRRKESQIERNNLGLANMFMLNHNMK